MSANSQPYFVPYDSKELLRRPLEPKTAVAIDPPNSPEVDDAISVEFGQDKKGRFAKITTYIADAALLGTYPNLIDQAAEIGFSTYDKPDAQNMLPKYVLRQLGLDARSDVGVPAIAVRIKAYENSVSLTDIERVRVHVNSMTYQRFGHYATVGNRRANDIVKGSNFIAKNTKIYGDFGTRASYRIVGRYMILANSLVAESMQKSKVPFIYRECGRIAVDDVHYASYSSQPLPHLALDLPQYSPFTSPLRRFPDLVNHLNLSAVLDGKEPPFDSEATKEIAAQMNARSSKVPNLDNAA